jgi:hypothetical protein
VALRVSILEQLSEVKVVMFLEKARKPIAGILAWLERLRDLRWFNGKQEI